MTKITWITFICVFVAEVISDMLVYAHSGHHMNLIMGIGIFLTVSGIVTSIGSFWEKKTGKKIKWIDEPQKGITRRDWTILVISLVTIGLIVIIAVLI